MPVTTSAGTGQPVSHAAARLADVNGLIDPAQHAEPCRALAGVHRGWDDVPHEVKAHRPSLLFFILDQLIGSFEPDLLQLDKKLDQIQLALLAASPPGVAASMTT